MSSTTTPHHPTPAGLFAGLAALARSRPLRAAGPAETTDLSRLSLRTLDDLGLLSAKSGITDQGLVERVARLRDGWP